jgi:hypothetical protein
MSILWGKKAFHAITGKRYARTASATTTTAAPQFKAEVFAGVATFGSVDAMSFPHRRQTCEVSGGIGCPL